MRTILNPEQAACFSVVLSIGHHGCLTEHMLAPTAY